MLKQLSTGLKYVRLCPFLAVNLEFPRNLTRNPTCNKKICPNPLGSPQLMILFYQIVIIFKGPREPSDNLTYQKKKS